jgi:hypothetical protein
MKSAKSHALLRFSLAVLAVLLLSVSFAFAKKPVKEPTYSWSVYIPVDATKNLQGVEGEPGSGGIVDLEGVGNAYLYNDPETTRNFVKEGYFNFEIFLDLETGIRPQIGFNELDLDCSEEGKCDYMFSVITNQIPTEPYVRIWFGFPGFSGYQYDEQLEGTTECLARGYFDIDANYMGEPKYYPHPDVISGDFVGSIDDITVTRTSENIWHIQVDVDNGNVSFEHQESEWHLDCNKKGNVCSPVLDSYTITEKGTASSMKFDLYFVRVAE